MVNTKFPPYQSPVTTSSVSGTKAQVYKANVSGFETVSIRIKNTGSVALNAFEVAGNITDGVAHDVLLSSAANLFTTPRLPCRASTVSPVTLASSNAVCLLTLDVRGLNEISLNASVASSTTTLEITHIGVYA